jgi:predicted DNA-binding protein
MSTKYMDRKSKKVKVGTVLDEEVFKRLKELSEKEGRPISEVIQDAVLRYEQLDPLEKKLRLHALERLLSVRFNIPDEDWKAIMEEDYYTQ